MPKTPKPQNPKTPWEQKAIFREKRNLIKEKASSMLEGKPRESLVLYDTAFEVRTRIIGAQSLLIQDWELYADKIIFDIDRGRSWP